MTKKHFIALADAIRDHNKIAANSGAFAPFDTTQIDTIAAFCKASNPRFNWERWIGYIAGTNGKNGGKVKPPKSHDTNTGLEGDVPYGF